MRIKEDEHGSSHHNLINLFNKKKIQKATSNQVFMLKRQDLNKQKVFCVN